MSILLKPEGTKKDDSGINTRKMERTGKDTFVIHADGSNYFEGRIKNPQVRFKSDGFGKSLTFGGVCIRSCINRDSKCNTCYKFSEFLEASDAKVR